MKTICLTTAILFVLINSNNAQYANQSLSNLNPQTKVNHSLQPIYTSVINLGNPSKKWKNLYLSGTITAKTIKVDSGGISVLNSLISANNNFGNGIEGTGDFAGVKGTGTYGIQGFGNFGVYGQSNDDASGVWGNGGFSGFGVRGNSHAGSAVYGASVEGLGGEFFSESYWGLRAETSSGDYAGAFYGDVYTTGSYLPSDNTLKENIQDFNALELIDKLSPKYYQYKSDAKFSSIHLPKGNHYGLLAQDVEEILPGLVKESVHKISTGNKKAFQLTPDGKPFSAAAIAEQKTILKAEPKDSISIKAVNYTELIPVLIKAMQEQQTQIQELNTKNTDLQSQINHLNTLISKNNGKAVIFSGYLKQNTPNPAGNNTIINYYLPANTTQAQIRITDIKGSTIKIYNGLEGEGYISVKGGELPTGVYNYTLLVKDKMIDSKQMVITK